LLPDGIVDAAGSLRGLLAEWIAAEIAPGRLMPWLPVAFGFGIVVYFSADREPAWWAAVALAIAGLVITVLARHRAIGFQLVLGLTAVAAGFAIATLQTERIAHTILRSPAASVLVSGFVEVREERERSDRIVLRVQAIEGTLAKPAPERVRVAVRKGTAPAVGSFVEFKARLSPPMQPLRPGGYDFARDMYFQRIGASGYALGAIKAKAPPVARGFWLQYATVIDDLREAIDKRIRAVMPGDNGSIASALITGKRDAISTPVNDAMYVSSLAHVRLSHGSGGGDCVLFYARRPGAASFIGEPLSDQEMGGALRANRGGALSPAFRCRGGHSTLIHHDRNCAHWRHAGSTDAYFSYTRGRGDRSVGVCAAGGYSPELPDVICGHTGACCGVSIRAAMARQQR
jgi:competence protein ComEC